MFDIQNLMEPSTLEEAMEMLEQDSNIRIVAGGTDVLIKLHHGDMQGASLLSLRKIRELEEISLQSDGTVIISAMATFSRIFFHPVIRENLPSLCEAAVSMGGPQIRNIATIGGNICNGAVSADSASTLFALNARLKIESKSGARIVPIREFYAGPGKVNLNPGEILTQILISKNDYKDTGSHYIKWCIRKAMDIANLGVSVVCRISDGRFADVRIGLGVAAPVPIRCDEAEKYAVGKMADESVTSETARLAVKSSKARDSWRASKAYREHLIEVLTKRALTEAALRARKQH
ncbi:MAG: xanthine dehydrogenase FAD-binding subunit XdhB [Oligoflexales bacterium]|nr:xanthine dehydrogenase FAD-binding subunit XdhB [Oligoflexales bacterium]